MDYTPDLHFIESQRGSRLGWHSAIAELIDNSFDAGALQVVGEFEGKKFTITDDGSGAENVSSMVRLGSHKRHKTTSLGTYGVGVKEAWLWAGDTISIRTTFKGQTTTLRVTFPGDLVQQDGGRWLGPDPTTVPATPGEKGTSISIENLNQPRPSIAVVKLLSRTFMPALDAGRQIIFKLGGKRMALEPYRMPILTDTVRDSFSVAGRDVSIEIGIIEDGQQVEQNGFLVCYGHRVIKTTCVGTGEFSGARMAGKIVLGKGWRLTKNKDDLRDLSDELGDAIYQRIRWLCEKATQLSEDIESDELRNELSDLVNEGIKGAKSLERRSPTRESVGSILPKDTGNKRRRAAKFDITLPGSVEYGNGDSGKRRRGIQVDWCQRPVDVVGEFDAAKPAIMLNTNNPFVARIRNPRNRDALYAVAMGILVHAQCERDGKQILLLERGDFLAGWGRILCSLNFTEDRKDGVDAA